MTLTLKCSKYYFITQFPLRRKYLHVSVSYNKINAFSTQTCLRNTMELSCKVQTYSWGKKGTNSLVAKLQASASDFAVDNNVPYAELWMGTHVNGPSTLKKTGETLSSVITKNPEYLGSNLIKHFGKELPFLFKVLSVNTALSIQAHPSKKHAEELHSKRPDIYKDPNHKPELAIALTPFEALCGFRPYEEIRNFVRDIPELRNVIGVDAVKKLEESKDDEVFLKQTFRAVLTTKHNVAQEIDNMLGRFQKLDNATKAKYHSELIERLNKDYPNDIGCFMVYFLNYLKLHPHEAIFLAANEPHAYLSGDCIENMACSDNVVRAGLTPKYIDVETLCSMLVYKGEKPDQKLFKPIIEDDTTSIFKPPVPDFAVAAIKVPASRKSYKIKPRSCASILLVISGQCKAEDVVLKPGVVIFIPANESTDISDIKSDLCMYQALANV